MKLDEIVGGHQIRTSPELSSKDIMTPKSSSDLTLLGSGVQGMAFDRLKKVNQIKKVFGINYHTDGYYRFLKAVERHQDNPYLPRISNIRLFNKPLNHVVGGETLRYEYTGTVNIEKLVSLNNPKVKRAVTGHLLRLGLDIKHALTLSPDTLISSYKQARSEKRINKDPQFEEAIRILNKLSYDIKDLDTHSGNIMVRLTSTGPQLVLVDPIYTPQ